MDIKELSYLKEQISSKEKQLESEDIKTTDKKELIKEIITEQIEPILAPYPSEINPQNIPLPVISPEEEEVKKIVDDLTEVALNNNVVTAVKLALKTSNGYIIDTLRDHLADIYYDQLKEKGLI